MTWEIFKGTEKEWQDNISKNKGHYRQSFHWGNYKSLMNWKILRLKKIDKDGNLNLVQITYKKIFFFCAAYIPGDTIGDSINLNNEFKKKILEFTNSKILYLRLDSTNTDIINEEEKLLKNNWNKTNFQKQIPRISICNLDKDINEIIDTASYGWKKNYLKSLQKFNTKNFKIKVTDKPSPKDLVLISNILTKNKKVYKPHSEKEFEYMIKTLRNNILFCIAYDKNEIPIAYRGMIRYDSFAWDLSAATTNTGRSLLASFFVTIELLKKCKLLGVKIYNFGEMDKINKPGVYHFKQGIAKQEIVVCGEWEYSNVLFLKKISNFFISILLSEKVRKIIPIINNMKF